MSDMLVVGKPVSSAPGMRTYIGHLDGTPNFERPSLMPRGNDRKMAVADELMRVNRNAVERATPGLEELRAKGLVTSYQVNPLSNTVIIDVPDSQAADAWKALNKVDGMGRIIRDREVTLQPGPIVDAQKGATLVQAEGGRKVEWNVDKVNAPAVWAQGYTGQGVTVGIVDTGIDVNHPALKEKYRGTQADGSFDHSYNFFDAVNGRAAAYDDNRHGTHVAGTVAGSTDDTIIGMAPDAKLIGSKILSGRGSGTLSGVTRGLEWILAPRDADGNNPDPSKAPDVVNNSWGTNDGRVRSFENIWKAYDAAGIMPIAAAGNSGPRAGTVGAPGSYHQGISVAATDKNDNIARFSSRGPSPIKDDNGSDRKPDVAAPGAAVTSSIPGGGYGTYSGTSMASPAVSGVAALVLSKHKDLTNAELSAALREGVVDLGDKGYDYDYGYGRVDAEKVLAAADRIVAARGVRGS